MRQLDNMCQDRHVSTPGASTQGPRTMRGITETLLLSSSFLRGVVSLLHTPRQGSAGLNAREDQVGITKLSIGSALHSKHPSPNSMVPSYP